jgi:hypothetical protein
MIVDLPDDDAEIEELPDGSAIVRMEDSFRGPADEEDFYENLAETMNLYDLEKIGSRYLDLIDKDRQDREKRDKQYAEGLRRTGLGDDAPGGANFMGASRVVHPVMADRRQGQGRDELGASGGQHRPDSYAFPNEKACRLQRLVGRDPAADDQKYAFARHRSRCLRMCSAH